LCTSITYDTTNNNNRILKIGSASVSYDAAGNLTSDGTGTGSHTYQWDAENHLKSTNGVNYTYDGDLRRVEKSNGKLYWYSGGQVLEETDLSGNLLNDYVYLAGQRIARRDALESNLQLHLRRLAGAVREHELLAREFGLLHSVEFQLGYESDHHFGLRLRCGGQPDERRREHLPVGRGESSGQDRRRQRYGKLDLQRLRLAGVQFQRIGELPA
jgi:YD repeat-containing protein